MGFTPFGAVPPLQIQAATPAAGVALVNGTPTILTWTPPNDGKLHRFALFIFELVTTNTTGGDITINFTDPAGFSTHPQVILNGTQGTGPHGTTLQGYEMLPVPGGQAVTLSQTSPMTAGAATVWAEIWGS